MKKIILLLMLVGLVQGAFAQPEARRRAQQKAQNSKPGSLASKANLVSRYNSGQQTNQPKAEDESSSKEKKGKKK